MAYTAQGQITTPADRTSNVRLDNSGDMALMKQQAGIGNAILAGANMFVDQMQSADIMKASNMYNDKMSALRSELMQNKEENAMENMAKYEEGRQKILDDIYKNGPRFVRGGQGRQKFETSIERDWIGQKNQMRSYMQAEGEKYKDNQAANRLSGYNSNISEGYGNPLVLEENITAGADVLRERYKFYGKEKQEAAIRGWKASAYGNAISTALSKDDYDTAGTLLQGYGQYLDPKARASLDKMITERRRSDFMFTSVQDLHAKYGDNITAARAVYANSLGGAGGVGVADAARKAIGQNLGSNTCAIFTGNMLRAAGIDASLMSTLADGTYVNYENKGLTYSDRSQLRDGDIVFWSVDGFGNTASDDKAAVNSSDKAYKGITHVGVYDAKTGKVIQSGTHGVSAMDIDTAGYHFVGAAHQPNSMSPTEKEKRLREFDSAYSGEIHRQKMQENFIVKTASDQMLAMYMDGKPHTSKEYLDLAYSVTGNNSEMYGKLSNWASHLSKGGGYHTLSLQERVILENMCDGSMTEEKLLKELTDLNIKPEVGMEYIRKNNKARSAESKHDWTALTKAFHEAIGGKSKTSEFETMIVKDLAKRYVEYETNEKKKPPTPQDIVNYMKDVWSKDADTIKAAGGYGEYNPVALYKKGFYRVEDTNNQNYVAVFPKGSDKPRFMTKAAFEEYMKKEKNKWLK